MAIIEVFENKYLLLNYNETNHENNFLKSYANKIVGFYKIKKSFELSN